MRVRGDQFAGAFDFLYILSHSSSLLTFAAEARSPVPNPHCAEVSWGLVTCLPMDDRSIRRDGSFPASLNTMAEYSTGFYAP